MGEGHRMGSSTWLGITRSSGKLVIALAAGVSLVSCGLAGGTDDSATPRGDAAKVASDSESDTSLIVEDGRMLQPEGHGGPWFETEPSEPWERFVWRSQRYVGDPVPLRPLTGEKASAAFVGQPDICGKEVVERMGEMGFENVEGFRGESMHLCAFEAKVLPTDSYPASLAVNLVRNVANSEPVPESDKYGPRSSNILRSFADDGDDLSCVAQEQHFSEGSSLLVSTELGTLSNDKNEACRRAYLMYWLLTNLGITKGKNDQVRPELYGER